jgi:hypothetical protein
MKLSANFTLEEMTKSQVASRQGINNNPNATQIDALKELCINVLQPIRSYFDKPVIISSGFRSCELCIAIGSSIHSQHSKGEAADFEIVGVDNKDLFDYIKNNIEFDQMILEFYEGGNSGWVHVSYVSPKENRKQTLRAYRDEETQKVRYQPYG